MAIAPYQPYKWLQKPEMTADEIERRSKRVAVKINKKDHAVADIMENIEPEQINKSLIETPIELVPAPGEDKCLVLNTDGTYDIALMDDVLGGGKRRGLFGD